MASIPAAPRPPLPAGFGDMIRAARHRAGMSARALGRAVGRSHPWVTDLEDGVRPPSATMADRVSRALALDAWSDAILRSVAVDDADMRPGRTV
ncbi:helix-turn-helix domain-containing protein [Streptomyces sp. NPDC058108]|uniref:helix-turn-helix domain-containing protein n=1 Tax=Streptomyces sp. NPDC058108 TaxID=3346344 RepID=UPI0036EAFCCD